MRGRFRIAGGVIAVVLGLLVILQPGLLPLDLGPWAIVTIGGVMLLQAGRIIQLGFVSDAESIKTAAPEKPQDVDRPGDEIQDTYLKFGGTTGEPVLERVEIRKRLTEAAVAVIAQTQRITEEEAREQVESGEWCDDTLANHYLAHGIEASRSFRSVVIGLVRGFEETRIQESIRRTVNAIGGYLDLEPLEQATLTAGEGATSDDAELPADPAIDPRLSSLDGEMFLRTESETGHWLAIGSIALAFGGVGVIFDIPSLLLTGIVGVGFAAYASLSSPVTPSLSLDRSIDAEGTVLPGDEIPIELTVTNTGQDRLYDLRIVDGVPNPLRVTSGSPRTGTALRPGESTTIDYSVRARRGTHEFRSTQVIARPLSGTVERELLTLESGQVSCIPPLQPMNAPVPLREQATQFVGNVASRQGGGVEFAATREYIPGDPIGRIDWNRHARTGELATLEFREERAANVVMIIDARAISYVGRGRSDEDDDDSVSDETIGDNAVERSLTAAGHIGANLLRDGNKVGLASFGPEYFWLSPGLGTEHEVRLRNSIGADPAFSPDPPDGKPQPVRWLRQLRRRLPDDAQIIYFSPLSDDYSVFMARRLDASGFPVTVVSPDPTTAENVGHRLAFIERRLRLTELRRVDVPVVNWPWDQQLVASLRGAARRYQ